MPLSSPILDDRNYQQLIAELKSRIPVYNPEWTDHNESDPAITLLELFAFQAENLLYRFNQIPETTYLEYLRLLQLPLRPGQAARVLLSLTTQKSSGVPVPQQSVAKASKLDFHTLTETTVWPVSCLGVCRTWTEPPSAEEAEVYEFVLRTVDALPKALAERPRIYYETKTLDPEELSESLDFSTAVDGMIWIAILADKGFDKQEWTSPGNAPAILNIGFELDLPSTGIDEITPCPRPGTSLVKSQLEWQISTLRPLRNNQPQYRSLRVVADTTDGLNQGGVVRVELPTNDNDIGVPDIDEDLAGAGDFPPQLDEDRAERLICWIRVFRRDGSRFNKLRLITVNAAEAEHAGVAAAEYLGDGKGQASQVFPLAHQPVLPDNDRHRMILEIEEGGQQWIAWTRVDDFYGSNRESRHYVLDPESGIIRFGDGLRGRIPQWGERIRVRGYRHGGGAQGNVLTGAISKIEVDRVKVTNYLAATGGADAETVEEALLRIPGELRRRDRAVTAQDFQELAFMKPGVSIGRAECLPRFHPPTRSTEAAGVVTVMIWPERDSLHPNAPMPDLPTLQAVCRYLNNRRLVTTELYVIPPSYRKVAVSVALKVKDGFGIEAVRRWVELILHRYLAPLPPYGPTGKGWPLGHRVYGPELEAAALQVEGVDYLEDLAVAGWDEKEQKWIKGTVLLQTHEVPELSAITVVDGLPLPDPGEGITPVMPENMPEDGVVLPIPVLREEC